MAAELPLGTENEVAALVAVSECADLATDFSLVQLGALRLPEQRLVIGLVEVGLHVAKREIRPLRPKDRRHTRQRSCGAILCVTPP